MRGFSAARNGARRKGGMSGCMQGRDERRYTP